MARGDIRLYERSRTLSTRRSLTRTTSMQPTPSPAPGETATHTRKITRKDLEKTQVIGQVDSKFIVALSTNTLLIFDQHAADERVKLERYMNQLLSRENVLLVSPSIRVRLTAIEVYTLLSNTAIVEMWGLLLRPHDEQEVCINTLPNVIHDRLLKDHSLLRDILRECVDAHNQHTSHTPPTLLNLINSKACRNAFKFGDVLSNTQSQALISALSQTKNPYQCAHGRPTLYPLLEC
ncbi:hypothetical protein E3P77_04059 [Wallemia ichthyophaga]|uniref:MutL C-terminal dimerisation domain-containing protein n=3 Tax=Wallemia ichthyophaga TaxID=245174 RepID=A0A4T0IF00_WALIC|nr:DNA mismatch repair protein MLH3 [Wallemia ichthyophaga EXF-994]TIA77889.1 hypothetical protein E3P98_04054 [Wallemia ichthyophaga]EOQ98664.1 DNA mismatch repair protein MLH3 [Wallemia ichthyophaga EXF-994]TIA94775.1 hypothetical protein E3P95_04074 [Wallemia ichthyophaga]TIA95392.1 hypothetical protein E3P94_04070 [Wallemia ichthyophaga]TIB07085.1 hypothetical protein E3P93_04033 [Wallemia ichthyophaga]